MKNLHVTFILLLFLTLIGCDDDDQILFECNPIVEPCDYASDFTSVVDTYIQLNWTGSGGIEEAQTGRDTNFRIPFIIQNFGSQTFAYLRTEKNMATTIWQHDMCKGSLHFSCQVNICLRGF